MAIYTKIVAKQCSYGLQTVNQCCSKASGIPPLKNIVGKLAPCGDRNKKLLRNGKLLPDSQLVKFYGSFTLKTLPLVHGRILKIHNRAVLLETYGSLSECNGHMGVSNSPLGTDLKQTDLPAWVKDLRSHVVFQLTLTWYVRRLKKDHQFIINF